MLKNKAASKPATLEERQEVLLYCVNRVKKKAISVANLMAPDMNEDDVMAEVAMRVWKAMIKPEYLKKSRTELTKIGYVTAFRHIAQLTRTRLTRRDKALTLSLTTPALTSVASLLLSPSLYSLNALRYVSLTECIRDEAIKLAGYEGYEALIDGAKYDWNGERLNRKQWSLLDCLDYSAETMRLKVELLGRRVITKLRIEDSHSESSTTRIDGMWVQHTEAPRHVLAS
jgi:hypothetical protein